MCKMYCTNYTKIYSNSRNECKLLIFIIVLKYDFFGGGYLRFVSNFSTTHASLHCYYVVGVYVRTYHCLVHSMPSNYDSVQTFRGCGF
jgi:hypothetical protein